MAVRSKLSGVAHGIVTMGTNGENMPSQARFDQALYAVSRERQLTSRLLKARLTFLRSLNVSACEGFGVGRATKKKAPASF